MEYVVACNWEPELLEIACRNNVRELFGKLDADPFGGGRASVISRRISKKLAEKFIRSTLAAGIRFNYLLNGTCFGNVELTAPGQRKIRRFLDWLYDIGVRDVTVSVPYVAGMIRQAYPDVNIVVSMMAGVTSVQQALYWQELGASTVILFDNKDFRLIEAIKAKTGLKVEIPANLSCMNRCFQSFYHGNVVSHSSQDFHRFGFYTLPLCEVRCNAMKVAQPRRIIAGQWVRPQDVDIFEKAGVDRLKILDRTSTTRQLARCIQAYTSRDYAGNMADIIPGYSRTRMESYLGWLERLGKTIRAFARPDLYNVFKALPFRQRNKQPDIYIDAQALDGYLEGFRNRNCRELSCEECGWCDKWAKKAIRFDEAERTRFLKGSRHNLREFEDGSFYFYLPRTTKHPNN